MKKAATIERTEEETLYLSKTGVVLMTVEHVRSGIWQVTKPNGLRSTKVGREEAEKLAEKYLRGRED